MIERPVPGPDAELLSTVDGPHAGPAGAESGGLARLIAVAEAVRPQQWLKNTLIFVPLIAAQQVTEGTAVWHAALAFIAFSLAASATYVINDRMDLERDRAHPSKRNRPFASGRLPVSYAPVMAVALLGTAFAVAVRTLPIEFTGILGGYFVLTTTYSLRLKEAVLLDVFTLAGLYTLRILAGSAATGIEPSVWLIGFSLFLFLSLAMVKRYAELHLLGDRAVGEEGLPTGRSYRPSDLPVLIALGCGSGQLAVLVLALYIISDEASAHYRESVWIWGLVPLLLYWLSRAWIVVSRSEMHDDPLIWMMKDQISRMVIVAAVVILLLAA